MSPNTRSAREQAIFDRLVYPNTNVLRNKLGITDQSLLDEAEAAFVIQREPTRPVFKKFTLTEMQAIHKHVLCGVYEWAGQLRNYTTARSEVASFARPEFIESYFESAVRKPLQAENLLKGTTPAQFAARSAHFASEINAVHPFIDGNGRLTRLLLKDLANKAGYDLDIVRLQTNKGAWYEGMRRGFECADTTMLREEIFSALRNPERVVTDTSAKQIPDDYTPSPAAMAAAEQMRANGVPESKLRLTMFGIDVNNKIAGDLGLSTHEASRRTSSADTPQEANLSNSVTPLSGRGR